MSQIERLQKEAAAIQNEVVGRIRKEVAKYGLTPEQLFGTASAAPQSKGRAAVKGNAKSPRPPKYADGAGNTWGGVGKRPVWLHDALAAGKALEDFLIGASGAAKQEPAPRKVSRVKSSAKSAAAPKKRTAAKSGTVATPVAPAKKTRKPRAKPGVEAATA